jgi:DMSO/TMAO reductase YedYZ molybdopterin-dependent catalytic subunit
MTLTPAADVGRRRAALAGVVATAVALGVAELAAGLVAAAASPVVAVGDAVVDRVPVWLKNVAIALFGTGDKTALIIGVLLVCALVGAGAGLAGRRRFAAAAAVFILFGLLGVAAAAGDPRASVGASAAVLAVAVAVALGLLWLLLRPPTEATAGAADRRRFLRLAALGAVAAVGSAMIGRVLRQRSVAQRNREELAVPSAQSSAEELPDDADLDVSGLTPFVTPTPVFYRIDTALSVPRVDVATWRLRVSGMVDRPLDWSFDDLVARELREQWTTLCCVSNEVGGRLIGNARWRGVPLRDVLDLAGVQVGATQIVGRSVDGWTAGFPTAAAYDGRDAMIAVAMNGEPLPVEHGFPARLVVPGLYGYVSATKWLAEIELTTLEDFDAYWVPRGWSKEGPIKTSARIDVPQAGSIPPGPTAVAGVAWAQGRGIQRVEVQVDDQEWSEARLGAIPNVDTWRQWVWEWDAPSGSHVLQVRATDGEGNIQTAQRQGVMPDGATGYHRVLVQVRTT